jgi:hypothetical protein
MFLGRSVAVAGLFGRFQLENSIFMDHSIKKRVFSDRKNVSETVQTGSISLTATLVDQAQSENAAIAHGLKRQNPELLDQLIELYQHRLLRHASTPGSSPLHATW